MRAGVVVGVRTGACPTYAVSQGTVGGESATVQRASEASAIALPRPALLGLLAESADPTQRFERSDSSLLPKFNRVEAVDRHKRSERSS